MFWKIEQFALQAAKQYGPFGRVLDVGSFDVNGSIRRAISGYYREFIGVDMREGPGVDRVINGHDLLDHFAPDSFDLVTCCETLEHDDQFWVTVANLRALVKPGGVLLITAPGPYFFHHDFPSDYYRFTESAFRDFIFKGLDAVHTETYLDLSNGDYKPNESVMGLGVKPRSSE